FPLHFRLFPGKRLPPSVYLLPPPPEEISGPRRSLSLTCLARGFFPETLDLHWQKNQEPLPSTSSSSTSASAVQTG
ncbi:IGHM protein, partial [Buphagus erythrorhynchus]|nr:IGHM protein [Buphagus erythrorhynchus]